MLRHAFTRCATVKWSCINAVAAEYGNADTSYLQGNGCVSALAKQPTNTPCVLPQTCMTKPATGNGWAWRQFKRDLQTLREQRYHAEMEHLLAEGPQLAGQAQGFLQLMEKLGVMAFLAARLRSEAPATLVSDPAFAPAVTAVEKSLGTLREAILAQDASRVREALSKIKGPYSQLFLKFG